MRCKGKKAKARFCLFRVILYLFLARLRLFFERIYFLGSKAKSEISAFSIISKSYSQQKPRIPTSSDGLPKKRRIRSISLSAFGAWESSKPAGITWKMEDPWSISANTTPQDQISTLFVYV